MPSSKWLLPLILFTLLPCIGISGNKTTISDWVVQHQPETSYSPHMGIIISSAKTGKRLYEQNADQLFTPASIQKLYVATAALSYLHPNFTYKTTLSSDAAPQHHAIKGNVYLHFSGNPYLTSEDLQSLLKSLKQNHITRIRGNLILDDHVFDQVPYPPGWLWGDLSYSFAAPLGGGNLDQNKFLLHLTPAKQLGAHPSLNSHLPNSVLTFSNQAITTKAYNKQCPLTVYSNANNQYTVGGCLVQPWKRQRRSLAIRNLHPYLQFRIQQTLNDQGITVDHITFGQTPATATHTLASISSKPLSVIVKSMLTDSDNLAANALLKTLGQQYYQTSGTWQNGIHAMQHILSNDTGIDFNLSLLTDGAGLSRYNLTSPRQLEALLQDIDKHPELRNTIMASLPRPGKEGTLIHRMATTSGNDRIAAKTGSMNGVNSLMGFIDSQHNGRLRFVIIFNGFVGPSRPYHQFEDQLCAWLINAPRQTPMSA